MIENVKFKIIKQIFKSNNNDFSIVSCKLLEDKLPIGYKFDTFTLTGNLLGLYQQNEYTMDLEEKESYKYGMQYILSNSERNITAKLKNVNITSEQNLEILNEICSSQKLAKIIHNSYPNFVQLILSNQEDKIDYKNKIKGMGEQKFKDYVKKIKNRQLSIIIQTKFPKYNFTIEETSYLLNTYKTLECIEESLNNSPYIILNELDRNWEESDTLLSEIRPDLKNSNQRCETLMYYLCKKNENQGSTRINARVMASFALQIAPEVVVKMKEVALKSELLHYDEKSNFISTEKIFQQEKQIADCINYRLKNPINFNIDYKKYKNINDTNLTDEQTDMLKLVNNKSFGLLIGNAGSGKTSTVNNIIHMLQNEGKSYTLLAPTGIASKRLAESTNSHTYTIHRAFYEQMSIESDVCIIDEISMCGVQHISMVSQMISDKTKLFFIGDNAQLASISCGNILEDLLTLQNIPIVKLTKVFRYGKGSLATIATDIRNEKPFIKNNKLIFDNANSDTLKSGDGQYEFIPISNNPLQQILNAYSELLKIYDRKEILILSPFNIGEYGTIAINNLIQNNFNKKLSDNESIKINKDISININDLIINKQNSYDVESYENTIANTWNDESDEKKIIYNGSIGEVINIDNKRIIGNFDNELLVLDKKLISTLKLAYAISIHSIQGNQKKAIIVLTSNIHSKMLTNNLLYVALTRASEKIIHIGNEETINNSLNKHETYIRETWLKDLLK